MIEDIDELGGDRVLVYRHSDTAETLRGELRPVEPRPVVAGYGEQIAAAKPVRRETRGEFAHLSAIFGPVVGLPDPAVLLADRRPFADRLGIATQQPR